MPHKKIQSQNSFFHNIKDYSEYGFRYVCIVLYYIVMYCIVLYCIVLYCIVLYCIVLYCMYRIQRRTWFSVTFMVTCSRGAF